MIILSKNEVDFYGELLVASFTVTSPSLAYYVITNWAFFPDPDAPGKMGGFICVTDFNEYDG